MLTLTDKQYKSLVNELAKDMRAYPDSRFVSDEDVKKAMLITEIDAAHKEIIRLKKLCREKRSLKDCGNH